MAEKKEYSWQNASRTSLEPLPFLRDAGFGLVKEQIILRSKGLEMIDLLDTIDQEINTYVGLKPHMARLRPFLARQAELYGSFAISKLEGNNTISLNDAKAIQANLQVAAPEDLVPEKIDRVTAKDDYSRLEYKNIVNTYRLMNDWGKGIAIGSLTLDTLSSLHKRLTYGLDRYEGKVIGFSRYNAGELRDTDEVVVNFLGGGNYKPIPCKDIEKEVDSLVAFLNREQTIVGVNAFIAALYAVHPFRNGNKRLCRILEHGLLRGVALNKNNVYFASSYYHNKLNLERFHDRLKQMLIYKNLTPFINIAREALFFSMLSVMRYSIENQRKFFLDGKATSKYPVNIFKPLAKQKARKYGDFLSVRKKDKTDRTIANYLKRAVDDGILAKTEYGKNTYYSLNLGLEEEEYIKDKIKENLEHLDYIPRDFAESVYLPYECPLPSEFIITPPPSAL